MGIIQVLMDLYAKYDFLKTSPALNEKEKAYLDYIKEDVSDSVAGLALYRLSLCLTKHYGRKVLIFLDEYDTPLQEAYVNGYWNELTAFLRGLFNSAFKTNPQSVKEKSLEETVENALNQIKNKRYDQELKSRGIPEENIHHYGFAFEGKKVLIRKDVSHK